MRRHAVAVFASVIGGCLMASGCVSPAIEKGPGVSNAGYTWDTLHARLDYPIAEVHRATDAAVNDLGLVVLRNHRDGVAAEIATMDAQREYITICLEAWPRSQTKLDIRAGTYGDRNKSAVIYEQILQNLGGPVAAQIIAP